MEKEQALQALLDQVVRQGDFIGVSALYLRDGKQLAYAQAGGIVFEPFFISNDKDLALFKRKKWPICRAIADAIAAEVNCSTAK